MWLTGPGLPYYIRNVLPQKLSFVFPSSESIAHILSAEQGIALWGLEGVVVSKPGY